MSRNGSGTYSLPAGNPVVTGTTISSTWANSTLNDIASALTGSLAADGQTTASGNLNMGNNKITNLTDGTNAQDAVTYSQLVASTGGLSGRIVQIVQTIGSSSVTNSTAYVPTGHSASITPTSVSSKILVLNNATFAQTNLGGGNAFLAMYRNGSAISGGDWVMNNVGTTSNTSNIYGNMALMYVDSPATTSALTYVPYIHADSGGTAWYAITGNAHLILMEIL